MPKGKRTRVVALTRTRKKGLESKKKLIEDLRQRVEEYDKIFVFSVRDMRNGKLKDVRARWKTSRFFFGKNKVMAIALGRNDEEEQGEGLHQLAAALKGQCGLMFTNSDKKEVLEFFENHVEPDYARAGNVATETVTLNAGPLPEFPHSLEPYLRTKLGLKTSLQRGVIHILNDHVVCKKGETLNPEQTRLLKLMNQPLAEFRVNMIAVWNKDGSFERFREDEEEEEGGDFVDMGSEGEEMESD